MAADMATISLGFAQIALQIAAAYFAYFVYTQNRRNKAWLAVVVALGIMTLRRVTVSLTDLEVFPQLTGEIQFVDRIVLPFTISVLLMLGLWSMKREFDNFRLVEKKLKQMDSE